MTCTKRGHSIWTTCACPDCSATRYRQTKLARNGRYHRVPADVALAHVLDWTRRGYSPAWIGTATGLGANYVQNVVSASRYGRHWLIGPAYAAQIVHADITTATAGTGPALGARRRLQALAANGWTVEEMGHRSGVKFTTLAAIQRGATQRITAARMATVLDLWGDLSATPGSSAEATRRASLKGWAPPAAWDDIDNPHEAPDAACRDTDCALPAKHLGLCATHYNDQLTGRTKTRNRLDLDALADCAGWGMTVHQAADRLGVSHSTIEAHLSRRDPQLSARFARNSVVREYGGAA